MKNFCSYVFVFLLLLSGCRREVEKEIPCQFVLEDSVLGKEIASYRDILRKTSKIDDFRILLHCRQINDSIHRYVISAIEDPMVLAVVYRDLVHTVFVDGEEVLLTLVNERSAVTAFKYLKADDAYHHSLVKDFFLVHDRAQQEGKTLPIVTFEPDLCYLTFLRDSLINKTMDSGLPSDKIKVCVHGEETWM